MSNSIWKMPDLKPEENKLIFAQHDRQRDGNIDYFIWDLHEFSDSIRKDSIRWCYLDNLIAQADKAERLQKAVDLAQEHLLSISDGYDIMKADAETIKRLFYAIQDEASETYKEIKQLIKE